MFAFFPPSVFCEDLLGGGRIKNNMKKLFEAEYGNEVAKQVKDWIEEQTLTEEGGCKVFRPYVIVEIFDQNGCPVSDEKN